MAKVYTWRTQWEAGSPVELVIPDGYTEIEKETFRDCKSLKSVIIPEGVKKIEWRTFEGCTSLQKIAIPESVTEIGWFAFGGCASLHSVTILNPNITIGKTSFSGCTALTEVNLPDCLDWIKENNKIVDSLLAKNKYISAREAAKMAENEKPAGNMRRLKITRTQTRDWKENDGSVYEIVENDLLSIANSWETERRIEEMIAEYRRLISTREN